MTATLACAVMIYCFVTAIIMSQTGQKQLRGTPIPKRPISAILQPFWDYKAPVK